MDVELLKWAAGILGTLGTAYVGYRQFLRKTEQERDASAATAGISMAEKGFQALEHVIASMKSQIEALQDEQKQHLAVTQTRDREIQQLRSEVESLKHQLQSGLEDQKKVRAHREVLMQEVKQLRQKLEASQGSSARIEELLAIVDELRRQIEGLGETPAA